MQEILGLLYWSSPPLHEVTMNVYWIDANIPVILLLYITYIYIYSDTMTTQYKTDIVLIILLLLSQ